MFNRLTFLVKVAVTSLVLLCACTSIDCPLDNVVECTYALYDSKSKAPMQLADTLTVSTVKADGADTILLNRLVGCRDFALPMRHVSGADTLLFRLSNTWQQHAVDTVIIAQEAVPYYEDLDCPASIFHTLISAKAISHQPSATSPVTIDSIIITCPQVTYDNIENIRIYMHASY